MEVVEAKYFLLNVVVAISSTLPNGNRASGFNSMMFDLDRVRMLSRESAVNKVETMVLSLKIPKASTDTILNKVMDIARVITDGTYRFVTHIDKPFITLFVTVEEGVVTEAISEFEVGTGAVKRPEVEEEKEEK